MIQLSLKGNDALSIVDTTSNEELLIQKDKKRLYFLLGDSNAPGPQYAFTLTAEQAQVVRRFLE